MEVRTLKLYHYRNLADQELYFAPRVNFIVGRNGQGKTNIVEALTLLSAGRSFRTNKHEELTRWSESSSSVFASVHGGGGTFEVGVAIEEGRRVSFFNGNRLASLAELLGKLLCVTFSPCDLELVKGGPSERRRFIDRHAVDLQPSLVASLVDYGRALRHKSNILRSGEATAQLIRPWNEIMAREAVRILGARRDLVHELSERSATYYSGLCHETGRLSLEIRSSACKDEQITIEKILAVLQTALTRELRQRSALVGPHRDDLVVLLNGKSARAYASQGQARSIVLAMKMGVISLIEERRQESPVVLLDDVDSELDEQRRDSLVKMILQGKQQVFVTGTHPPREELLQEGISALYSVVDGEVFEEAAHCRNNMI